MKKMLTGMLALVVMVLFFGALAPSPQTMREKGELSYALRTADASRLPAQYAKLLNPVYPKYAKM